jgi:YgiT-type zinc finger domain-containing protein
MRESRFTVSEHVVRYLTEGKISLKQIEFTASSGSIIEIHRHERRGESTLLLGHPNGKPFHVLCADSLDNSLTILLAYVPAPPIWKNSSTRDHPGKDSIMEHSSANCFFCGGPLEQIVVGNFDYRLQGALYVVKNVPAVLCHQCGEKYVSAEAARRIAALVDAQAYVGTEKVQVLNYG